MSERLDGTVALVTGASSGFGEATAVALAAAGAESLRQEFAERHLRVSAVEPGAVDTELPGHNRPEVVAFLNQRFGSIKLLEAEDITHIVTRPRHVAINQILVRPTEQVG